MEICFQNTWLMTSISVAWILTMTSSSRVTVASHLSLTDPNRSLPALGSLLSLKPPSLSSHGSHGTEECCENGGLCVMGVFCHCPEKFYGFRCEFERQMRSCGSVKHLQWVRVGCNLCRCFDSNLTCLPRVYSGCDNKENNQEIDLKDYQEDIEIFPIDKKSKSLGATPTTTNPDSYYYDYGDDYPMYADNDEENNNHKLNNSSGKNKTSSFRFYFLTVSIHWIMHILYWTRHSSTDTQFLS